MTSPAFENSYARLPANYHAPYTPDPVAAPSLIRANDALAQQLGIDPAWLHSPEGLEVLAGNRTPDGATPIATAYAGHQFGQWNPTLGDGRAVLLGEIKSPTGQRVDIQLKGSGPTPYSRGGDGRAPVGPVLREYIVSEAMAALGVPTTRSLAAVATGEPVFRELKLPGAVLTRTASSHIRVGTVQFFAMMGDTDHLRALLDHVIERHYPDVGAEEQPYLALLAAIGERQAKLIAQWQLLGFIHGVMNTDNMLLAGETIDYGPCAFLDAFDPTKVFSSIDRGGRYAYQNQPGIAHWNLCRLAEAMLPVFHTDTDRAVELATTVIQLFTGQFEAAFEEGLTRKIGLDPDSGTELGSELLTLMAESETDFTLTFGTLTERAAGVKTALHLDLPTSFNDWLDRWNSAGPDAEMMAKANPVLIPRNHRIEEVIRAAVQSGDYAPFHAMVDALADPFTMDASREHFATPPEPDEEVAMTFCGT